MQGIRSLTRRRSRLVSKKQIFGTSRPALYDYGNISAQNLRSARMSVSVALPQLTADMRPDYQDDRRHRARQTRLEERQAAARADSRAVMNRKGIRAVWALLALGLLAVLLLAAWIPGRLQANEYQRRVMRLQAQISDLDENCLALQREYESRVAELNIGYQAVEIGMISGKGVKPVDLYVPEGAVLEPASSFLGQ